ncbi:unnamed protein product [Paramecium sonneborni]|uniref:MRH domain-containing protein n=1 Tax=Paramecium sonneborni TaxID=65129 RepID=A0A8S1L7Q7_9CILI|nr:unnamed protein product [Paramecium sonneborni]
MEFNVITERVAAFQLFHNKCYTIGLKSESDIWYDSFGLNLKYKNGDLCGETLQYSVQFQIQCDEETPFKQVMTDSPCNIMLQATHPMACRKKTSYFYYYLFSLVLIIIGLFLMKRKKKQEQGYVLV